MGEKRDPEEASPGRGRRRTVTREEQALWYRSITDVTPLPGREAVPAEEASTGTPGRAMDAPPSLSPPPVLQTDDRTAARMVVSRPRERPDPGGIGNGLDRRTMLRLRRGAIPPETQVDLHRCTQNQAHELLTGFLAASQAAGRRCVLVITGKGYGSDGAIGVLKTMVPRWLDEPPNRARILAVSPASPSHGGDGALYVLLRRDRRRPER